MDHDGLQLVIHVALRCDDAITGSANDHAACSEQFKRHALATSDLHKEQPANVNARTSAGHRNVHQMKQHS